MYKENHYAFELHLPVWYKFLLKISLLSSLWPTRIHISIYIKKWYRFPLHESTEYCMRLSNIQKPPITKYFLLTCIPLIYRYICLKNVGAYSLKKVPMSPYPQDDFTRHYFKRYGVTLLGNRLLHLVLS